jgi:hypothetical protein
MEKQVLENHVIKPAVSIFESDTEYRLIPFMTELSLDSKIAEIENFMFNNNGFGKSEYEKDTTFLRSLKDLYFLFTNLFDIFLLDEFNFASIVFSTFCLSKDNFFFIRIHFGRLKFNNLFGNLIVDISNFEHNLYLFKSLISYFLDGCGYLPFLRLESELFI